MNYATIKPRDIANGPGVRVSLFVSGCTHHCRGCFNEEAWDFGFGQPYTPETTQQILELLSPGFVRGLTLLGGEPFDPANQETVLELVQQIRTRFPEKTIWAYTGYLLDTDLLSGRVGNADTVRRLLRCLDVLVDGPFVESQKNLSLRFRGSENQRLIDMKKTLAAGEIILWSDWQGQGKGMTK